MPRKRVAVVGGGVSGLATAYILAKDGAEVEVYEKDDTLGGHAKTVIVDGTSLDLGFMVFNRFHGCECCLRQICLLSRLFIRTMELFENLGVDRELSDLSFSVSLDEGQGCEWGTRNGLSSLFAQKTNVLNPYFWNMIREIIKFKDDASAYVDELENNPDIDRNETLEHFIRHVIPTCASIWSCTSGVMSFSAYSMLSFLRNNPTLQRVGCPQRLTPRWHSQSYVNRVVHNLQDGSEEVFDGYGFPEDGVKLATEADFGFPDAYINGDFSFVDKNEGLLNFFLIFIANTELNTYMKGLNKKRMVDTVALHVYTSFCEIFLKHILRQNTLTQARQNISEHYDLSNELFSLFLDETMTYSCAIFQTPDEDFKNAQLRKIHTLIDKARISKEHHVLEIGCGWGSLALEVVKRTGCRYTGITLSEKQLQYAEQKVKEAGLQDQIQLLLCDYRQLPKGYKYDRIISCEMIEAVGHEYIEEFFRCCESALTKNGIFVLQFISAADEKYDEFRLSPGFIKEYIFPGGCLPSLSSTTSAMAAASRLRKLVALGFDEAFVRKWEYYFDNFAAGFKYCISGLSGLISYTSVTILHIRITCGNKGLTSFLVM
ncbi:UNVERIFIED_CONTAM: Tuberculostearic acid methyltransferase UfaA1 [Sesamum calycinum]|uniref:Tuberculostearic acid methyltransferase UfaA1 n=1 Tax=Sesamum calycinum TaxID=2727403 RepID=A0AAW2P8G7_9LAMI